MNTHIYNLLVHTCTHTHKTFSKYTNPDHLADFIIKFLKLPVIIILRKDLIGHESWVIWSRTETRKLISQISML